MARPGAVTGRNPNPDYACRRSLRTIVDAGSIPAASIISLNNPILVGDRSESFCILPQVGQVEMPTARPPGRIIT